MAYYDFKKKPALTTKEGEKDVLYPSIVFNGTINTKQLLKQLVARTGYKPGVVEGTLMELVDLVGEYIGQGYRVEVGEFGYFSGKIKSRLVKDKKDLRSWNGTQVWSFQAKPERSSFFQDCWLCHTAGTVPTTPLNGNYPITACNALSSGPPKILYFLYKGPFSPKRRRNHV